MYTTRTLGRITAAALFAVAALIIGISTALAAAPNWDTTGNYEVAFTCVAGCSGTYNHDLSLVQTGGSLTGSGGNPVGAHVYNWALTSGTVDADAITFTADYSSTPDAVTPQTTMVVNGTIVGGSMSGTWSDNYQGTARSGTWATVSGTAAPIANTPACSSDDTTFDTFTLGSVNGQHGWSATGPYDQAIVNNTYGYPTFGCKSLRISDAVTSGSFGDWVFSYSVANEAGETAAENGGMSGGTRQNHFEAQFDLASVMSTLQPGMHMSVSPDRGDGARMSYLRFDDMADGIHVFFDDVDSTGAFIETDIATLTRTPHTIKFVMDFVDGANNDIVKIYIDGVLEITGTSWENYFNISESNPTRTVDSLIFQSRTGSGPLTNPANQGNGFLVDNVSITSGMTPAPAQVNVTIVKYVDEVHATAGNANSAVFPMQATYDFTNDQFPGGIAGSDPYDIGPTGNNTPDAYEAKTLQFNQGADYSTYERTDTSVVGATCQDGKPFALNGYSSGDSLAAAQGAATSSVAPAFTEMSTNKFVIVHNKTCTAPAADVKVVINKFIDGQMATALSANNSSFPMQSSWNAANLGGAGSGSYDLSTIGFNSPTPYQAVTSDMTSGSSYSTNEVTGGSVVGAACADGKPFALNGYSSGDSLAAAQSAATSSVAPALTNITTDKYIIVWNTKCVAPPVNPVPPANACATPGSAPAGYTLRNGTSGADTVTLAPNTMFVGKGGNDKVTAGDGNYIVCTAGGNDTITLGNGNSSIDAGGGNNTVAVGHGEGSIKAAGGNDTITAGDGARTIDAGGGNNKVTTGGGAQTITAAGGNDEIAAGAGADTVNAGGGNNKIWGEAGSDMLTAAGGNDLLDGGADTDTCQAGAGTNTKVSCEL